MTKPFLITILQSIVSLMTQISIARILVPEVFGQFAICSAIITIAMTMTNFQSDKYIVMGKDRIQRYNISFYSELLMAIAVVIVLNLIAPYILSILDKSSLLKPVQVLSIAVFYNPLMRRKALFEGDLDFVKARVPLLASQIISSIIAIILALNGYEIWSLISWRLTTFVIEIIVLKALMPKLPKVNNNWELFKEYKSFFTTLYLAAIAFVVYSTFDYYILANFLNEKELGLYWMCFQLTAYFIVLKTTLNGLLLPIYASIKENVLQQNHLLKNHVQLVSRLYMSLFLGSIIFGEFFANIVLGEKWMSIAALLPYFLIITSIKSVAGSLLPQLIVRDKRSAELAGLLIALAVFLSSIYPLSYHHGAKGALASAAISSICSATFILIKYMSKDIGLFKISILEMLIVIILSVALFEFIHLEKWVENTVLSLIGIVIVWGMFAPYKELRLVFQNVKILRNDI